MTTTPSITTQIALTPEQTARDAGPIADALRALLARLRIVHDAAALQCTLSAGTEPHLDACVAASSAVDEAQHALTTWVVYGHKSAADEALSEPQADPLQERCRLARVSARERIRDVFAQVSGQVPPCPDCGYYPGQPLGGGVV